MYFQIKNLIIWPKLNQFPPRVVKFELGKVNVITGASRTGKSAIIPIIDYCLASSDCFIPIDTIRDHASWYGVVVQTENEQILFARKVPDGTHASNEFYVDRGTLLTVPPIIESANEKQSGVKNILNTVSAVPSMTLHGTDENIPFQGRLGFRDLMALVFQNQDIVANQNILFYKTHAHEHRRRLRLWFPFILGAENTDILVARQRIEYVEKRLKQLIREVEKAKVISDSWLANMRGHLRVAEEYGILRVDITKELEPEELLAAAREIVADIPDFSKSDSDDLLKANQELIAFEKEEQVISSSIGVIKKRLSDLGRLKVGLTDYGSGVRKRVDRLQLSQWIQDISQEAESCPACGSHEHPNASEELQKISKAFKGYEEDAAQVSTIPDSFEREEVRLKNELDRVLEQKESLQSRYDQELAHNKKAQDEFQTQKSMFLFLGHLEASMNTFDRLTDSGEFAEQISRLEDELETLLGTVDRRKIQTKLELAIDKISQGILKYLNILDVEEKYRLIAPRFSYGDLNIKVKSNEGNWHFLAEVGSASNWVAFHLALMCALQEFFIDQAVSPVPSFVIFDQPSQVYFPKVQQVVAGDDYSQYKDEDAEAVKSMFQALANSVSETKGQWQCIVLDHADSSIYGDIVGVEEVAVWRDGEKLIPEEWYQFEL